MLLPKTSTPRWMIVMIDLFISFFSLVFAYLIRFDLKADYTLIQKEWEILSKSILIFFGIRFIVFYFFKIHKGLIRFTSTEDVKRIFLAVSLSSLLFMVLGLLRFYFFDNYFLFPMSVLFIEFLTTTFLMIASRFAIKLIYMESVKSKKANENIIIYGAGVSGLITKRTIEKDQRINYTILGFIDDNKKLNGSRVEGVKIYHIDNLEKLLTENEVSQIIIAIQKPNDGRVKELVDLALKHDVKVNKVPNPKSWINGEFSTKQINKIKIEDLLGRDAINLDTQAISKELKGKIILITGAAGSIGSGLVKQIAAYEPKLLVLLDQSESPLYDLQIELKSFYHNLNFDVVIGDVRNYDRMQRLFDNFKPEVVFHAAAYKHVPLMENNPAEAIQTNVGGTKILVDLAGKFNVEKFVMISTDKAVNPTNVMGGSKRIAEIYAQNANSRFETKYITTRFGNVLGSNGSVIPLFQRQIESGGPITLTDENITRYFMTIPEACQLVLEAGAMGKGGEIFVFDMGESVKIIDLAKNMIRLSGLELGKDIEIKVVGLRPGEKLYEELLADNENTIPTHHPQILIAKHLNYSADVLNEIDKLINLITNQNNQDLVRQMKKLVPEFISNNSEFEKLDKK